MRQKRSSGLIIVLLIIALWIVAGALVSEKPLKAPEPAATAVEHRRPIPSWDDTEAAVKQSDDFGVYRGKFIVATKRLVVNGECTLKHFRDHGGWVKSTSNYPGQPVYFVVCGRTTADRIYLNARTEEVFR